MGRRDGRRAGGHAGGIAWLCQLIEEHGAAIDYDLITMTRYTLHDVGGALPWGAFLHFVQYVPRTSALSRELNPTTDDEKWAEGHATAAILADTYDLLNQLNENLVARGANRRASHVKPYPRPWAKGQGERKLGRDPIPVSEFEAWWESA